MKKHEYLTNFLEISKASLKSIGVFVLFLIFTSSITAASTVNTNTAALNKNMNSIVDTTLKTTTGSEVNVPDKSIFNIDTIITVHVGHSPLGITVSPDGNKLYVANLDRTVSVIDTATNKVTATVELCFSIKGIAFSPDGKEVCMFAPDELSIIDTQKYTIIATVKFEDHRRAFSSDGKKVYEVNRVDGTVSVIDTATNNVIVTVPAGPGSSGVAVNPAGTRVYVVNSNDSTVSVIDTATNKVTATVPVGTYPSGVAVNPAGTRVYVVNSDDGTVSVIDTATNKVTSKINVSTTLDSVIISPDGKKVYLTNYFTNYIRIFDIIDTTTNKVTAYLEKKEQLDNVALSPDGKTVYVLNGGSNTISIIKKNPLSNVTDESSILNLIQIMEMKEISALQQSNADTKNVLKIMQ